MIFSLSTLISNINVINLIIPKVVPINNTDNDINKLISGYFTYDNTSSYSS